MWMERRKECIWFHLGFILLYIAKCSWKKTDDLEPSERHQGHLSAQSHECSQRQTAGIQHTGCEDVLELSQKTKWISKGHVQEGIFGVQ